MHDHHDDHHRGLAFDMSRLLDRRGMLATLSGAALVGLVGCAGGQERKPVTGSARAKRSASTGAGAEIPDETAGPFPGDGSNGPNILTRSGIVRGDIRSSFGSASGVAAGVPLVIELAVTDNGTAYQGAAVYVWHCDRAGKYSMYSPGVTGENYLRGVQQAGRTGLVRFTSIFPAAYPGRWPHIHFEVYSSLDAASNAADPVKTSQLAFPEQVCAQVYATSGYQQSAGHLRRTSLEDDNVFGDGYTSQLATITGDVARGYIAALAVPV